MPTSPLSPLRAALAALPAGVAVLAALAVAAPAGSLDDVFVVLSDARAWIGGVPGVERPQVEASTSPLDVLVKAAVLVLAPDADPLRASGWVEVALLVAVALLAVRETARLSGGLAAAAALAVGVVLAPGLVESAAYRLEGPLFALFWLGTAGAAAAGRPAAAFVWATALVLARPEGLVLGPAACWLAASGDRAAATRWTGAALGFGAAITLVRLGLFGDPVPNTFYAKSSSDRVQEVVDGARYLGAALASWAGVGVVLLCSVLLAATGRRRPSGSPTLRLLTLAGIAALVVVVSGGDAYLGARLALPVGLPVWLAAAALWRTVRRIVPLAVAAAVALEVVGALPRPWPGGAEVLDRMRSAVVGGPVGLEAFDGDARACAAVARALDGEIFAHRHVQRFRWFEPTAPVLDLTGITDRDVARRPVEGQVLFGRDAVDLALERRVGAIHLDPLRARPAALSRSDLVPALADPAVAPIYGGPPFMTLPVARAVAAEYVPASLPLPEAGGYFNVLVRGDLVGRFQAQGFQLPPL